MASKKILALDQASNVSGWAIFEDGKLQKYGKFNAELGGNTHPEKLFYIRNKVEKLIDDNNITEIYIEDIQLQANRGNNVATFKILAEVFGVISELVYEKGLPQTAVLASVWKSKLGIKGKDRTAQKRAAQEWVATTYAVRPTQDEVDAVCIGSYASLVKNDVAADGFDWSE